MESSTSAASPQAAISRLVVQAMHEHSGRGPTRANTTIGKDSITCVLGDTLTKSEQTLVDAGYAQEVLQGRRRLQEVMRVPLVAKVEDLTGRNVIAFVSENHIAPDLAVEVFILEPKAESAA